MAETQTNTGFTEVGEDDFSKLSDNIKNSEVSGFSFKEEQEEPATEDTGADKDKGTESPGVGKISVGKYVKAPWVLKVVDRVMPTVFVASFKLTGYEIDRKEFKLAKDDDEILLEPLQELLDYIVLDLKNPWNKFLLALSIVYTSKVIENLEKAKKVRKKKPEKESDGMTYVQSTEELLNDLAQPDMSWAEAYSQDEIDLIKATRKRRNKSYEDAIEWLKKKGQLKEVQL